MLKFKFILFSILTLICLASIQTKAQAIPPHSVTISTAVPTSLKAIEKLAGTFQVFSTTVAISSNSWVVLVDTRGVVIASGTVGMIQAMRQIKSSGTVLADGLITSRTGFASTGTIAGTNITMTIDNLLALSTSPATNAYDKRGDTLYGAMFASSQTITFTQTDKGNNSIVVTTGTVLISSGNITMNWGRLYIFPPDESTAGLLLGRGNIDWEIPGKVVNMLNPTAAQDAATKIYVDQLAQNNTHYIQERPTNSVQVSTMAVSSGTVIFLTAPNLKANTITFGDGTTQVTAPSGGGGTGNSTVTVRLGTPYDAFITTLAATAPSSWVVPKDTFTITGAYAYCMFTSTVADTILNVGRSTETGNSNSFYQTIDASSFTIPANSKFSTYRAPSTITTIFPNQSLIPFISVIPSSGTVGGNCWVELDGFKWPR